MGMAKKPMAWPRWLGGKTWKSVEMASGIIRPPANPWSTRPRMSTQKTGARPHSTEEAVKTASATVQMRFMVKRCSKNPAIGVAMPLANE
jgi:hypothetical protein